MRAPLTAPLLLSLTLLTACKTSGSQADTAEAAALDYVRLVQVALNNAYYEGGQKPIPAVPCNDPLFGMKKPPKIIEIEQCAAKMPDASSPVIAAKFKGDLAVLSDGNGTRRVRPDELPEVK